MGERWQPATTSSNTIRDFIPPAYPTGERVSTSHFGTIWARDFSALCWSGDLVPIICVLFFAGKRRPRLVKWLASRGQLSRFPGQLGDIRNTKRYDLEFAALIGGKSYFALCDGRR